MKKLHFYEIEINIIKAAREWKSAKTREEKEVALKEYRYWCAVLDKN